jgi:aquaporin Z
MKPWQKYLAEFFGTFVLVFIGTVAVVGAVRSDVSPLLVAPFAFGLALLAGLYAFAEVSGGHYNPAVSLGLFLDRRLSLPDLLGYWASQLLGGIAAAVVLLLATSDDDVASTATVPGADGDATAFVMELALTAIFVCVILQSSKSSRFGGSALIAIPLTLVAIHFAAVPFSGSSVNPARTFGPALIGGEWDGIWIYFVAPLLGAVLAWLVYTVVVTGDTDVRDDVRALRRGDAASEGDDRSDRPR